MGFAPQLAHFRGLAFLSLDIRLKPVPFLRIVVGEEGDADTYNLIVLFSQAPSYAVHRVGKGQQLLSLPSVVFHGHLHSRQDILNLKVLHLQFALGPLLHLFADAFLGIPVLHGSGQLY